MAEFGECIMFRPPKTKVEKQNKNNFFEPYVHGIWMGSVIRSGEPLVGTVGGVYRAGQVRRVADDVRWSQTAVNSVKGCPHEPVPGKGRDVPTFVRPELRGGEALPPAPRAGYTEVEQEDQKTRPLYVRKEDIATHGPTKACRGCLTVVQGRPYSKPHTAECRARFAELLADTEEGRRRVARTEGRLQDAVAKQFESIMKQQDDIDKKRKLNPVAEAAGGGSSGSTGVVAVKTDVDTRRKLEFDVPMTESIENAPASVRAAILGKGNQVDDDQEMGVSGIKRRPEATMAEIDPQSEHGRGAVVAYDMPAVADAPKVDATMEQAPDADAMTDEVNSVQRGEPITGQVGSECGTLAVTDEAARPPLKSKIKKRPGPMPKPRWSHDRPEQRIRESEVHRDELAWKPIGSGMWARTFKNASCMITTTKSGPCEADVYRRIVRDVETGKVMHDCIPDNTCDADQVDLDQPRSIRIEPPASGSS